MATTTTNYGLKKPSSSDFYNIGDFNGNADIIDAQMKTNADAAQNATQIGTQAASIANGLKTKAIYTLSCTKSGKVYTMSSTDTLPTSGYVSCLFKAPADYGVGDSFKMGSVTYAVAVSDGEELPDKAFVKNAIVPVVLDQSGKTINFKQAGRKLTLSAESYVMAACYLESGTFTAPMTGKYRVTCIGKGGDGDDAHYQPGSYALNGAGGGAGGAASSIFSLTKGEVRNITVDSAVSSFGIVMTAAAGQKGQFAANQGGTTSTIAGGTAGTVSANMGDSPVTYTGQAGKLGEASNLGKGGGSADPSYGGDGGAYTAGQSGFLSTVGGAGGKYAVDSSYNPTASKDGDAPAKPSPSGLFPFGVGGGGGMYYPSQAYMGGKGGKGAVIVELVLD